ncbi:dTMP kinase [bacterium]|nr:dTMP kinase [bacterium]
MIKNIYSGKLIAVDGPNGSGKTTLIECLYNLLLEMKIDVYITKEPTDSELGVFLRQYAEDNKGIDTACLVATDRYQHLRKEIIPKLMQGSIVITDRYVLSSLILQCMDDVDEDFILDINRYIVRPDLQICVVANEKTIQNRLLSRKKLTRYETNNQTNTELKFLNKGMEIIQKENIDIVKVSTDDDLNSNIEILRDKIMTIIEGK